MKRTAVYFLSLLLCFSLFACGSEEPSLTGSWETSGTVSIIGENAPAPEEITERWTFTEDGTATAEVSTPETDFPAAEFTYTYEQGVLTLAANGRSTEYTCAVAAETMTWNDNLVFTRIG